MITIKKLNNFESSIQYYRSKYPMLSGELILIAIFLVLISTGILSIMLFNSSGVGSFIIGDRYSGMQMAIDIYNLRLWINFNQLITYTVIFTLTILLYFKIKDLLIYKNENL